MNRTSLIISVIAVILSFIGGFLLANSLNKNEIGSLRAENDRVKASAAETKPKDDLSEAEIKEKIAEADAKPDAIDFQRNLGVALYSWAAAKQDTAMIGESIRLMERAFKANPSDIPLNIGLGHAYFDIGYFKKDMASFEKARNFYQTVLKEKPDDAGILTDLGLTYFLHEPSDNKTALKQFELAVKADPKNERALEYLIQALTADGNIAEAEKRLAELTKINPSNKNIAGLTAKISELKAR